MKREDAVKIEKASGTREAFEKAMRVAKALAGTAVEVCGVEGLLDKVKEEWRKDMEKAREEPS